MPTCSLDCFSETGPLEPNADIGGPGVSNLPIFLVPDQALGLPHDNDSRLNLARL